MNLNVVVALISLSQLHSRSNSLVINGMQAEGGRHEVQF
jgi:hypothetical protein